jgi:hypothetical protein
MRTISLIVAGSVLASCTAVPPPPTRTADAQQQYESLLAGKVAQAPMTCLPNMRAENMIRIDENTVVFRESSGRIYVNHMQGPCTGLPSSSTALVTNEHGTGPCSGDIVRVVDTSANMPVGACAWGEFTPYVRPGA